MTRETKYTLQASEVMAGVPFVTFAHAGAGEISERKNSPADRSIRGETLEKLVSWLGDMVRFR